ncbi:DUF1080 domain-containing protein [Algibacter miyuki]|uniref:DUF1080 domain-containing protein n=1 Tax=Algibacter miyuki TaxID=1306933 RepID=A0ABV5H4P7_9FLAO|nr:DUF1080 domain-containing protein [Algibacter miyuki]MDN3663977.1 DUF1080 domain-containing protein [Algibacter miyuki]
MTKLFKILYLVFCISFLFNCKKNEENKTSEIKKTSWKNLLTRNDLNDWIVKIKGHEVGNNYKNTFVVENGILKVNYDEYDNVFNNSFGHIYYKKPFSNYKFRMDYRFTGNQLSDGAPWAKRNSGIMFHCEDPNGIGLNQNFPVSIEVQLLGGNGTDERSTGNLCSPGTHVKYNDTLTTQHIVQSTSKTYHGEQWVHVEIEVRNDSIIKHMINGEEVLRYSKPQYGGNVNFNAEFWKTKQGIPLKSGYISLQSESHPVEFKNIEIMEL